MRYLVRAFVIKRKDRALLEAVESGSLGKGSIAYPTYIKCMKNARLLDNGQVRWIEPCYCREAFARAESYWKSFPTGGNISRISTSATPRHSKNAKAILAAEAASAPKSLKQSLRVWVTTFPPH